MDEERVKVKLRILVTGSAGHLGQALVQTFRAAEREVVGVDILESPFTDYVGSITDREFVARCMAGVTCVLHTATLHKPHVTTHPMQAFIDTNVTGTLNLLEAAWENAVESFIFTSTTSVFGNTLRPPVGEPAVWVTEDLRPVPRNIYGVTKAAAEDLCELFHAKYGLACVVLRTSRFFPEKDDDREVRLAYNDANVKANELLFRRVDIADVVEAHIEAMEMAPDIGFDRFIISATTPFRPDDVQRLRDDCPSVVVQYVPQYEAVYLDRGWKMCPGIDRVYDNRRARELLNWTPHYDFSHVIACLEAGGDFRSPLARSIGSKGYHPQRFAEGPYPVG